MSATKENTSAPEDPNVYMKYVHSADDTNYFGAKNIVDAELQLMKDRRGRTPEDLTGLALSGGGIRSASFALGVLQAFAHKHWLTKIDYLSTVSGGGYIGTCLSFLLHRAWTVPPSGKQEEESYVRFGLDPKIFPLGSYPMTGETSDSDRQKFADAQDTQYVYHRTRGELLRFLRQHAKYLTPGGGINLLSLLGVVLRNSLVSLFFFLSLAILAFDLLGLWGLLPLSKEVQDMASDPWWNNGPLTAAAVLAAVFVALAPIYSLFTWLSFRLPVLKYGNPYRLRRMFEISYAWQIGLMAALGLLGCVPYAYAYLAHPARSYSHLHVDAGVVSLVVGIASALMGFFRTSRPGKKGVPISLLTAIAASALLFGLLMLGCSIAHLATSYHQPWGESSRPSWWWTLSPWSEWWAFAGVVLGTGWLVNLNYVSLHRYYRDRLAETFMPDVSEALDRERKKRNLRATEGTRTVLGELWGGMAEHQPICKSCPAPYHIINANVVLVSSRLPKFRGRGGDNFIFSPLFCGSNATGWAATSSVIYKYFTLASAMAVSGAAINPNAGTGGEGATRQPVFAMLMGVLNIRLGYWLPNPKWLTQRREWNRWNRKKDEPEDAVPVGNWITRGITRLSALWDEETPNFIYPGLGEVVLRRFLDEDSCLLQLSDGGHFENLGLYELVRRKLKVIVVCDGGADPDYKFADLANAIEKVRADFGALISFDGPGIEALVPVSAPEFTRRAADGGDPMKYAERGYIVGRIRYADNTEGTLLYLSTTFCRGLSEDLYGYRRSHPEFPDEPTGDQLFDEQQFEAYRELGYQIAYDLTEDPQVANNRDLKRCISGSDEDSRMGFAP